jgi:FkbM family methyltransferase
MYEEVKRQTRRVARKLWLGALTMRADMGFDPYGDMKKFVTRPRPIVFDVGANVGQTIRHFHDYFPDCTSHSFEPSPATFLELQKKSAGVVNAHIWNCALGSTPGQLTLHENEHSDMSSFLPLGAHGWGNIKQETTVDVRTVDEFCREQNIDRIDVLKSDTQGFDLEVFKGAEEMMRQGRIGLLYFEVTFFELYQGLPKFSQIYDFLANHGFMLVTFYRFHYRRKFDKSMAAWTDAMFVHESYIQPNA